MLSQVAPLLTFLGVGDISFVEIKEKEAEERRRVDKQLELKYERFLWYCEAPRQKKKKKKKTRKR